jgi:Na+:H+ antiporter, NhaC family
LITIIIFIVIGFFFKPEGDAAGIKSTLEAIEGSFNITPLLFIVPVALVAIIISKVPPLPSLNGGNITWGGFCPDLSAPDYRSDKCGIAVIMRIHHILQ